MEELLNRVVCGDSLAVLKTMPSESVDCVITSPPYWALRDYGIEGQLGLEPTFQEYVTKLCDIFDEVKRVLKKEGTCWVNLGDTYYTKSGSNFENDNLTGKGSEEVSQTTGINKANQLRGNGLLPEKCLCQIPSRFAIEMTNRGWILRADIIWAKGISFCDTYSGGCMPSSADDRVTRSHEYVYMFVKSKKYFYDIEAVKERSIDPESLNGRRERNAALMADYDIKHYQEAGKIQENGKLKSGQIYVKRNLRSVWTINTACSDIPHFAMFPEELITPMIKAGCPKNGVVLDIFFGSGTTGIVARKLLRNFIGIELSPKYCAIAQKRLSAVPARLDTFCVNKPLTAIKL